MYTYGYLFYIPITLVFGVPFIIYGIIKKRPWADHFLVGIAAVYLNFAIKIAFFPLLIKTTVEFDIANNISWRLDFLERDKIHLFLNILLTFPIGFGMQFITNFNYRKRMLVIFVCGASFEIVQFILLVMLKPINLIFDVNDLVCNIMGAILGFASIHMVNVLFTNKKYSKKSNVMAYVKNVCISCADDRKSLDVV